jgi:1,4-alpha-glucan branching enzyme
VNDTRPEGFEWIESNDAEAGVYAWVRKGGATDKPVVAVVNMTPWSGVSPWPAACGHWREILNTDAEVYGGGNRGNLGGVATEKTPWHGQTQSALVTLPPLVGTLSATGLKAAGETALGREDDESKTEPAPVVAGHGFRPGREGAAAG